MPVIIQLRRDTAANWTSYNPVLAEGELGYELDTMKFKVGDGSTEWNDLPYTISDTTTASNIGTGEGVFSGKVGDDLQFKSLIGDGTVTVISGANTLTISGGGIDTHGDLSGLDQDDHVQYVLVDGTRGFTNTVSGVYPTSSGHLATRGYVDDNIIFGNEYDSASSLGASSTTSTTYLTKVSITKGSGLPNGTYRVAGAAEIASTTANRTVAVRLINTTDSVVYNEALERTSLANLTMPFASLGEVVLSGSNKTFAIQYCVVQATTVVITNARLEFWRIS